jgi:hypothetical protein
MARKRGGLAGLWDRNKKVIKPVATLAAGALTGGAGGALVGGLMNGLDREGKGGIGFDAGKGALGAATGYGMGKLGQGVGARLGMPGMFGGGGNAAAMGGGMPDIGTFNPKALITGKGEAFTRGAANSAAAQGAGRMGIASSVGNFLKDGKNLKAIGDTAIGGMNAVNQRQQQRMQREEMERRRRLEDEQLERQRGMDPMRAQLLAQIMQRLGGQGAAGYEAGSRVGV